ncbi:MAG: efflux RND transporter periplasmic adaptor subunit [Verrucomicrobiota bacterium]
MTRFGQFVAILVIFSVTVVLIGLFFLLAPEAETVEREVIVPTVEVVSVNPVDYKITIASQGVLEAETASTMASEIAGQVVWTDPRFEIGGVFEKDEILLSIDSADYKSALEQTKAEAARARLELALEEGRKRQALKDWERLGGNESPTPLVLREPQLESAKAAVAAAEAAVAKAQRDLDRTDLKAPYYCRVAAKYTDLGSFVTVGSRLADVESASEFKVRLPISVDDNEFFPPLSEDTASNVTLIAEFNGDERSWPARIIRQEGAVERSSRSVFLVAAITKKEESDRLKSGLFVRAEIEGNTLSDVFRVPRFAFLDPRRLLVVENETKEGTTTEKLRFREVNVLRTESEESIVNGGLNAGDRICLTAIDTPINGTSVQIAQPKQAEGTVEVEENDKEKT